MQLVSYAADGLRSYGYEMKYEWKPVQANLTQTGRKAILKVRATGGANPVQRGRQQAQF